jgi:hypothetical protein
LAPLGPAPKQGGRLARAAADDQDYRGYAYMNGGYQLFGNIQDNSLVALGPQSVGDAAIEVTATQTGALTPNGRDGVGIVFYAGASLDRYLAFFVGYDGRWYLAQYKYVDDRPSDTLNGLDDGASAAINNGPGQPPASDRARRYVLALHQRPVSRDGTRPLQPDLDPDVGLRRPLPRRYGANRHVHQLQRLCRAAGVPMAGRLIGRVSGCCFSARGMIRWQHRNVTETAPRRATPIGDEREVSATKKRSRT